MIDEWPTPAGRPDSLLYCLKNEHLAQKGQGKDGVAAIITDRRDGLVERRARRDRRLQRRVLTLKGGCSPCRNPPFVRFMDQTQGTFETRHLLFRLHYPNKSPHFYAPMRLVATFNCHKGGGSPRNPALDHQHPHKPPGVSRAPPEHNSIVFIQSRKQVICSSHHQNDPFRQYLRRVSPPKCAHASDEQSFL